MRKISLLVIICFSISSFLSAGVPPTKLSNAQQQRMTQLDNYLFPSRDIRYRLTERVSSDNFESLVFSYDNADRLICISESSDMQVRDSLTYNNENQVIRIDGYQWMNQTWAHVYYVDYTYDENGRRISRTNYNNFGGTFELGGIYQYSYVQNVLVRHDMYLGGMDFLYETCYYIHEADGLLKTELYLQGFNGLDSTMKIAYSYNAAGQLTRKQNYIYEEGWSEDGSEEFVYDDFGNCSEHNSKDNAGSYTERRLYEFNTTASTDEVLLPNASPELFIPEFFNDANMRVLEHWYTMDANFILQYVCDYHYLYNGEGVGIGERTKSTECNVYPNPTNGIVYLSETDPSKEIVRVSVYDLQGRKVESVNAAHIVDLSNCNPGVYVLRMESADGSISIDKVIKK